MQCSRVLQLQVLSASISLPIAVESKRRRPQPDVEDSRAVVAVASWTRSLHVVN